MKPGSQPLLSIIVPVYNKEKYLAETIESLFNQTYSNFEIILVNDGSTDASLSICQQYCRIDHRVRLIEQKNSGVSSARNAGLTASAGEYIGFIDSDDTIEPEMYAMLIRNLMSYDADISVCSIKIIYPKKIINETDEQQRRLLLDHNEGISAVLKGTLSWSANNKVYKAALAKSIQFEGKVNEDLLYVYKAFAKSKKAVFENALLYNYIKRENSVSMHFNTNQLESIAVSKKIVDLASNSATTHRNEAKHLDFISNISILNLIILSSRQKYLEEYQSIVRHLKTYSQFIKEYSAVSRKHRLAYAMFRISPSLYCHFTKLYCRFFYSEAATKLA